MATYTGKIYADDSYMKDVKSLEISYSDILTSFFTYDFFIQGGADLSAKTGKVIRCVFKSNHSPAVYKKKLINVQPFIYITQNSFSAYGPLMYGFHFGNVYSNVASEDSLQIPFYSLGNYKNDIIFSSSINNSYQKSHLTSTKFPSISQESATKKMFIQFTACVGYEGHLPFNGERFYGNANFGIHSHQNANPPYLLCTYEDVVPTIENMAPASGFVDKRIANVFSWKMVAEAVIGNLKQKSAVVRWRPYGTSTVSQIAIDGNTQSCTIPANTFNTDYLEWQVTVTTEDNMSNTSSWVKLTTVDTVPDMPNNLSPSNSYLDGERVSMLTWNHNVPTGSTQKAFDVQYKQGDAWISLATHKLTADEFLSVSADTFASGEMVWQVRTYNTDDQASPWAVSSPNIVKAKAVTPEYTSISSTPQVSIGWQSTGQESWELEILQNGISVISDWGVGSAKKWKSKRFLEDGSYTARLRIQNIEGGWSDFAETIFTVQNVSNGEIMATAIHTGIAVTISWNGLENAAEYLVLRNGKAIHKTGNLLFVDTQAMGKSLYHVRAILPDGNYTQSNEMMIIPRISNANIMVANNPAIFVDLIAKISERPSISTQTEKTVTSHYFAGRSQPVFDVSEHYSTVHTFEYAVKSKSEQNILDAMFQSGALVLYRHPKLDVRFYGIITAISKKNTGLVSYAFTIQECPEPDEVQLNV